MESIRYDYILYFNVLSTLYIVPFLGRERDILMRSWDAVKGFRAEIPEHNLVHRACANRNIRRPN